jgi:hypothetical protein
MRGARGSGRPLANPPLPTCADSFRPVIIMRRRWNSFARHERLGERELRGESAGGGTGLPARSFRLARAQAGKTCREDLVAPSTRIKAKRLLLLKQQIEKNNDDEWYTHQPQQNACHECVSFSEVVRGNHRRQDFVPGCTRFHPREPSEATSWRVFHQSRSRKWKK